MKKNSYKIVCFGDSTTDATFFPNDTKHHSNYKDLKVFSRILEDTLPALVGKNLEIINSGISGDTTEDAKQRFHTDVLANNPDVVLIQFGVNDQSIRHDLEETQPSVSLEAFSNNLHYFIAELKEINTKIILMTPGMLLWTEAFKNSYFKPPYNLEEPLGLNANLKKYVQEICKLALLEEVALINIFNKQITHSRTHNMFDLLPDGIHPNNKGHQFIANIILSHFKL